MEPKSRIKLKPESIKKNMYIKVSLKDSKQIEGFFKKFMFKNTQLTEKQNQYRDTIEDIIKDFQGAKYDQIYLFLTSSEDDDKKQFAKMFSIQIKDIEDIRLVTPVTIEPFIKILQIQIDDMTVQIKQLQQQIQQIQTQNSRNSQSKRSLSKSKHTKSNSTKL